jgi:peptide/nickel transport system substrate-binding protein
MTSLATAPMAKTLKWAARTICSTFDPHAQNHQTTLNFQMHCYEALTPLHEGLPRRRRARQRPGSSSTPTQWRFNLRKGVKFHDGTPFTADDVVFSYARAAAAPSNLTSAVTGIKEVKKIDDSRSR